MTIDPFDYVAENVFGHERRFCQPGSERTFAEWWLCQWCGRRHDAGVDAVERLPCPASSFPAFDIVDLMRALGRRSGGSIAIHLRYDPLRAQDNFTLIGPGGRICDTDTPLVALCEWVVKEELRS